MANIQPLRLVDLDDLSDWRFVPILTIEQAALLWAGINPAFYNFRDSHLFHPTQASRAFIARQAFLGGIMVKTLTVHELHFFNWRGETYRADASVENFTFEDVDIQRTTVMAQVLIAWAKRQDCTSLREDLRKQEQAEKERQSRKEFDDFVEAQSKQVLQIEYRPLEPKYTTPEFTVACEIVAEIWNKQEAGVKPPKALEIQELIGQKLEKLTGGKPKPAAIARIDSLTRPLLFKNQQKSAE